MSASKLLAYLDEKLPQSGDSMKQALLDVLLGHKTWRVAAISNCVTESGILKAMQRSGVREFIASIGKPH
jgi:hypothetical protein